MPKSPLVHIKNALFTSAPRSPPIFKSPLDFSIFPHQKWAVIGSKKTQFLAILNNQHVASPNKARSYPLITKQAALTSSSIAFLNFRQSSLPKVHISARYEYFKEALDQTVYDFVTNHAVNSVESPLDVAAVDWSLKNFFLQDLKHSWLMSLSNGQLRRARFAKAIISRPLLLLVDDPFLGLDTVASEKIASTLKKVDELGTQALVLGLRTQDEVPDWITHIVVLDNNGVMASGEKSADLLALVEKLEALEENKGTNESQAVATKIVQQLYRNASVDPTKPHVEFRGLNVVYRGHQVLENINFKSFHGQKWQICGKNGSGKTTLLSLITADHPQSWNQAVVIDGKPRKVGKTNYFDINKPIGMSSPELHSIFPNISTYRAIASGFNIGTDFTLKKLTSSEAQTVEFLLSEFKLSKETTFAQLSISDQKLVLFLRAIVKAPELLILDEAFSCMDEEHIVICKKLVEHLPATVFCIAHVENELPRVDNVFDLSSGDSFPSFDSSAVSAGSAGSASSASSSSR